MEAERLTERKACEANLVGPRKPHNLKYGEIFWVRLACDYSHEMTACLKPGHKHSNVYHVHMHQFLLGKLTGKLSDALCCI